MGFPLGAKHIVGLHFIQISLQATLAQTLLFMDTNTFIIIGFRQSLKDYDSILSLK